MDKADSPLPLSRILHLVSRISHHASRKKVSYGG